MSDKPKRNVVELTVKAPTREEIASKYHKRNYEYATLFVSNPNQVELTDAISDLADQGYEIAGTLSGTPHIIIFERQCFDAEEDE